MKRASLVAQTVKNLRAVLETQVPSLGQEDPLEKEMATHSSTLAWEIPWTEEPGRLRVAKSRARLFESEWLPFPLPCLQCAVWPPFCHPSHTGTGYPTKKTSLC